MSGIAGRRLTIAVASGKGGTGKTLVSTNLAIAAASAGTPVTLVDCDAEAPNAGLFLDVPDARTTPVEVRLPRVEQSACLLCGACRNACAFGAIRILGGKVLIFPELCHSCGACVSVCIPGALREGPERVGEIESGRVALVPAPLAPVELVTGTLDIGQVKTPAVIRAARTRASLSNPALTILDAPPGVACSAVAAVRDADMLVLVTEATPFGLHDLRLAVTLGRELAIPIGVVLNRAGLDGSEDEFEAYCAEEQLPVLARIPFDRRIAELYAEGRPVALEHPDGRRIFADLWDAIRQRAEEEPV